ncbi:MAG: hypothetical protein PHQ05_03210 [Sterolibacterium sp.]|nr:hypothetical protein [Sterolibacterium sp.]
MMRRLALLLFLVQMIVSTDGHAAEATPSDVYAQAVRIEQEVEGLKRHFKIAGKVALIPRSGELKARHVWTMSYVILLKLGKLRRKLGLTYIHPVGIEPLLDMPSNQPWGMTQRILTEIQILKFYLNIPGQPSPAVAVSGKRHIDAYNKLHQISDELELLSNPVTPSEVYAEAKRLNEDVNAVLRHLRIVEHAVPPPRRENLLPRDSLRAAFEVLGEIQRLQHLHGLPTADFKPFDTGDKTEPDDVFDLVVQLQAEWQTIKAQLGMAHHITLPAGYEENKQPSDVVQLLGYIAAQLREIKSR